MHPNNIPDDPPEALSGQWVRAAGILLLRVDAKADSEMQAVPARHHHPASDFRQLYASGQQPASFLLMRHTDRWDLPKGHCDGGETFVETAIRETEEETGLSPNRYSLDPEFTFDLQYPVRRRKQPQQVANKWVRYFLAWTENPPEIRLTEHIDYRWFPWAPPHIIQTQTIDPLLQAVAKFMDQRASNRDVG